jgi:oligopeptide/dipeptide ABC transporter ATP-binding protein
MNRQTRQDPILVVRDLHVTYDAVRQPVHAVRNVSFEVREAETIALVGESGSGKSTTGLALMGLLEGFAGVRISGAIELKRKDGTTCDIVQMEERALRRVRGNDIAMIFQEPLSSLNPVYTVGDQIVEAIGQHERTSTRAAQARAKELLAELGIPDPGSCLNRYPHHLSGGMRQRVMIAIALSSRPRLLIADEPTTALDVTIQAQILELLQRIQERSGMAIIFITHNLGVVSEMAQRAIVMYAGEIVEKLPVARLFGDARMPYTMALLRSVPRLGSLRKPGQRLEAISGTAPSLAFIPRGCGFHPRCQHCVSGRCDTVHPRLEETEPGHLVRCLRWQELDARVPA